MHIYAPEFDKKPKSASLKLDIDRLNIDKLGTTPVDLSKLSNVAKYDVVKKTQYDELAKKLNAVQTNDTSNLVKKSYYNTLKKLTRKYTIILKILLLKNLIC